ncbi:MAG: hypothetical protein CBB71_12475 [Rhodopirellula sp. TMED11]|nr:MAG: hypothetical protein CBB71_12475 [Rhodopirellula sp. TMED11]
MDTQSAADDLLATDVQAMFVYGTLQRGQRREVNWPRQPLTIQPAWIWGDLFGRSDYPALRPGKRKVRGELWRFAAQDMPQTLEILDEIEGTTDNGPQDRYQRRLSEANILNADNRSADPVSVDPATSPIRCFTYLYHWDVHEQGFLCCPVVDGFQHWTAQSWQDHFGVQNAADDDQ